MPAPAAASKRCWRRCLRRASIRPTSRRCSSRTAMPILRPGRHLSRERLSLRVVAGAATAAMVAGGEEDAISLTAARKAGGYPADFSYRACPVDQIVADGETLGFGDTSVTAVATPGHSHDHTAFLIEQ